MKTMKIKILGISEVGYKAQERYQERSKYTPSPRVLDTVR